MDDFQKYIHLSKYSRYLEREKRRETWDETVNRYKNFFQSKHEWLKENEDFQEAIEAIRKLEVMPSMRALMTAGKALERDHCSGYNCSSCAVTSPRVFDEIFFLLMCGCGVGFSVERQYISKLPEVAEEFFDSDTVIVVADSKIGWASALRELISLLYVGKIPKYDLSKIRPAGARLKVFGGRACLTGDTIVYKDRKKTRGYNELTIKELYDLERNQGFWKGKPNHFKDVKIRSLDEENGIFFRNNVLTVIDNGNAPVYEILTENGYRIKATDNHRFMKETGDYDFLNNFIVGDLIAVNGSKEKKTGICVDCEKPISKKATRCKICYDKSQIQNSASDTTARQRKECRDYLKIFNTCENCNIKGVRLVVHHIDENPHNNNWGNLTTLYEKCHRRHHFNKWTLGDPYSHKYLTFDKIISIKYKGVEKVYDLCMEGPNHNFVANGFVSHNSGPLPLAKLFEFTIRLFKNAAGKKLNSLECHDLMCKIAETVIVGSVRRAAMISFSNLSDDRMRRAKTGDWFIINPQRALANNSVAYTEKPDLDSFAQEWQSQYVSKSGERGIVNKNALKKKAESCGREYDGDYLLNPLAI